MRWTADELARDCGGMLTRRSAREIAGTFIDSRAPVEGSLFVPIVAARDGHDFIAQAVAGGAAAVLVARRHNLVLPQGDFAVVEVDDTLHAFQSLAHAARMKMHGPVVAITGSNGKTTTRAMITSVLESGFRRVLSTRDNLNNHLGVPLTLTNAPHEPDAMVLELGMSAPHENDALARIVAPTIGVITSVALEHLEFMGSLEAIAAAEAEIVAHLPSDGTLVVPDDEPMLAPWVARSQARVLTFGSGRHAQVRIDEVHVGSSTRARIVLPGDDVVDVTLRPFGAHNARNAAAALAVGHVLGLDTTAMVNALAAVEPVGDRGRVLELGRHLCIADCYNANPGSVEVALRSLAALRAHRSGPLLAIVGDMLELGPTELALHGAVGELAAKLGISQLFGFGPRTRAMCEAARAHDLEATHYDDIDGLARAAWNALDRGQPGAVLVKGSRGMQLERVVAALAACASVGTRA